MSAIHSGSMLPFESTQLAGHMQRERLFKVAARGGTLNDAEFQHLKHCVSCQERFTQYIPKKLKERGPNDQPENYHDFWRRDLLDRLR